LIPLIFNSSLSVSDNSGIFDVDQESANQNLYSLKAKNARTKTEIARDTLEYALNLYNKIRWFKLAEGAFETAKSYMETNGLTNELIYLKCKSTMALVSLSQSKYQQAEEYIDWSLATAEKMRGTGSIAYMANQNSRAKLYQQTGRYNEAEKEFDHGINAK
jgi:tetratricopeptide (TPR) repeat protein